MQMRLFCLVFAVALAGVPPPLAASNPIPVTPLTVNLESNPYLQIGMLAIASGPRTVTVTVDIDPESTLAQRVNQVHFGMAPAGWSFAGHEAVTHQGTSSMLLLTYRHYPAAT